MYSIRNKSGSLCCCVSQKMSKLLVDRYHGQYVTLAGKRVYQFEQEVFYGSEDIVIAIFPGHYMIKE